MRLSETDHDRVTAAVTQAETATTGEIVTIVARQSDSYHDVSMHWAVLGMLLTLALLIGWFALFYGALLIALGFRLRGLADRLGDAPLMARR